MRSETLSSAIELTVAALLVAACSLTSGTHPGMAQETAAPGTGALEPLPVEHLQIQGLRRVVRFHRPEQLAAAPAWSWPSTAVAVMESVSGA